MAGVLTDGAGKSDSERAALVRLFNDTRKRLVETGTRNRLIHVNRAATRGNVVNIVNQRSDDVYEILSKSRTMRFLGLGREKDDASANSLRLVDAGHSEFDESRYVDFQLETRLTPDALQKRLLNIAREAKTAEEEQGVNILYLALGFLTWFEDETSHVVREAPLVLLPVELVRNQRTSTYDVRIRDDDLITNLPLQRRIKDDFGIELPEVEAFESWHPSTYFASVAEVISAKSRWKIDQDAIQIGFFSFSKLLMFLDLAIDAWPEGSIGGHELTRGLLFEGFVGEESLFDSSIPLDESLPPSKLFHVVDADASQAKVIEEVRTGRNLVVQGPPGTGKSQTITNIIAAAAREGKRVLFIAEKMAALSVVHERIVKVGLRDVCLELHSKSASKKIVLAELARTLSAASAVPTAPESAEELQAARDHLNVLTKALHAPIGSSGQTPYLALGRQARCIGAGCPPPTINSDVLASMSEIEEKKLLAVLTEYGDLLAKEGLSSEHPFEGTRNLDLQPVDVARLGATLTAAKANVDRLHVAMRQVADELGTTASITEANAGAFVELLQSLEGLPKGGARPALAIFSARDRARVSQTLQAGLEWLQASEIAAPVFVEAAFEGSYFSLRPALVRGTTSLFARWGKAYRTASKELEGLLRSKIPKTAKERVELIDSLERIRTLHNKWSPNVPYCEALLGEDWRGNRTNFECLHATNIWCDRVSAQKVSAPVGRLVGLAADTEALSNSAHAITAAEPPVIQDLERATRLLDIDPKVFGGTGWTTLDLGKLAGRLGAIAGSTDRYAAWARLQRLHQALVDNGVSDLADQMRAGVLTGSAASFELQFARSERLWQQALESSPVLRSINQVKRHDLVAQFADLERQQLKDNVLSILSHHLSQVPQGALGEMKVIRGEIAKKQGHIAIRKLFKRAGTAVQRIKPVLLMSPISVAQFLPPGELSFDLLVIDEASQVRPEDALGAIARAHQIVVVGDQRQLPPSSFFDRLVSDAEDIDEGSELPPSEDLLGGAATLGSMESILTLCEARGLGKRVLTWHYRSRDPSLIEVSNREFYDDALILPPSPLQEDPGYGLCFTRVQGAYDRGGKRNNIKEGEAVVARLAEHARKHPTLSLGVITFSLVQRNLITELLELARRSDVILDAFLREGQAEDVFVKNIENVQGDERDVILVSVGYGPEVLGGRLSSMTFGPVNSEGGERRLNVLFTRARVRCEIFCSFDPGDIDLSRTSGEGPRVFKRFLDYAKSGRINQSAPSGDGADSPFELEVADVIRGFGFLADPQVGSAGFRIDMGIRHADRPGTYLLAVECDGATYHSALWARERDRLRQDVLEHLGWSFHRIWSTDWFYNRQAEVERLRQALFAARIAADEGVRIEGANRLRPPEFAIVDGPEPVFEVPEAPVRKMPSYQRAVFPMASTYEPHEAPEAILAALARRLVEAEGPIHSEEVARRVATSFGREKAGSEPPVSAASCTTRFRCPRPRRLR